MGGRRRRGPSCAGASARPPPSAGYRNPSRLPSFGDPGATRLIGRGRKTPEASDTSAGSPLRFLPRTRPGWVPGREAGFTQPVPPPSLRNGPPGATTGCGCQQSTLLTWLARGHLSAPGFS